MGGDSVNEQTKAVQQMQDYILTHIAEEITLADLAHAASFSPWYAHRLFRELTGVSPAEYIRKLRLTEAAKRLKSEKCRITELAMEAGWVMPDIAAEALYTGMVTDSGRFRYDSVSAGTFRRAAYLMQNKIDTTAIFGELYADDLSSVQLRASFVAKIRLYAEHIAYIYTTYEEFLATGETAFNISRGMVGTMSDLRGIDIWANFTETVDGVLCELRSSRYNINPIAVKYGGGGHAKASGATLKSREEAMAMLEDLEALIQKENEA